MTKRTDTWLRAYGSERRVAWVSLQACCVWGCMQSATAGSHNAHIQGPMHGRSFRDVIPLCGAQHHAELDGRQRIEGATYGPTGSNPTLKMFETHYELNLREIADAVEALWIKLNPEETTDGGS